MDIGFVGLGRMGRPMVLNLLGAGNGVTVSNRSQAPVDALASAGARPAASPAEVAAASDIVMTCVTNTSSVEEVYFGKNGLIGAMRPGQIFVDHSTVSPNLSRRCAESAASCGGAFLDAPVSGGPAGAEARTLTIMVGGDQATFDRVLPLFQAMGKNIRRCGPSGAGSVVKLANQLLVGINSAAVAEAMVLAVKAGADPQVVLEMIGTSYGGSTMMTRNVPLMLRRTFTPGTAVSLLIKDLNIIGQLADELSVRLLLGSVAREMFGEARASGFNDDDMAGVVRILESLAGVQVVPVESGR